LTIAVLTDSSAVMPRRWLDTLPIKVVPIEVAWADGNVTDGSAPYREVARRLDAGKPPKTAAPSPGTFEAAISDVLSEAAGVLVVCPSSELSGTYASAVLAARQIGDARIRVLDSKTAAAGQGLVAAEAARVGADATDIEVVSDRALEVCSKIQIWASLRQLDFLRRSGRLPAIATVGPDALGLQPIVRYGKGAPVPVGVVRGGERAVDRLYRAWERSIEGAKGQTAVFHSERTGDATKLADRMRTRAPDAGVEVTEVNASLGAHTGPGLLGVAWFWDN
jgi:DegV family protein with EDD domain